MWQVHLFANLTMKTRTFGVYDILTLSITRIMIADENGHGFTPDDLDSRQVSATFLLFMPPGFAVLVGIVLSPELACQ